MKLNLWKIISMTPVVAAGVMMLAGCGPAGSSSSSRLETYTVQHETIEDAIEEVGVIAATRVVPVYAPFRGRLLQIAETGSFVREGEPVVALEDSSDIQRVEDRLNELKSVQAELEANIQSLEIAQRENRLDLDQAEAQLSMERVRLEDVNNRLAETEVLLEREVVPADDLRAALFQTSSRRLSTSNTELSLRSTVLSRQLSQANSQLDIERRVLQGAQARRQFDDALARVESATVAAPASGMFQRSSRWQWSEQAMVEPRPGDNVRSQQLLGEIPDMDTLVVKSQIPENYFYRVEPGMRTYLRFDALDGVETTGTIRSIGVVAIEREASPGGAMIQTEGYSGQKVFEVTIELDNPTEEMRPGLSVAVRMVLSQTEDTLAVPTTAILRRDGQDLVRVRNESGRTEDRVVELSGRRGDRVVVTSGLNIGETIVLNPTRGS